MGHDLGAAHHLQPHRARGDPVHLTFEAEMGETKLRVVVPQHVVEILPCQLIPVLKA